MEYTFNFNALLIKAINHVVESEKSIKELGIDDFTANALIKVYSKINKKE